jgi:hypothetical protein
MENRGYYLTETFDIKLFICFGVIAPWIGESLDIWGKCQIFKRNIAFKFVFFTLISTPGRSLSSHISTKIRYAFLIVQCVINVPSIYFTFKDVIF